MNVFFIQSLTPTNVFFIQTLTPTYRLGEKNPPVSAQQKPHGNWLETQKYSWFTPGFYFKT